MSSIDSEFSRYLEKKNADIKENKNDFNILTSLLKYHDEVRLHSRLISSLLDPNGDTHYRGTLFLELFLKMVGLDKWGLNLEQATVQVEYQDIDLYITDGEKHLIIENKVWANDQPCQIIKYINIIVNEKPENYFNLASKEYLNPDKIRVLYLTPRAKKVSSSHVLEKIDDKYFISYQHDVDSLNSCSEKMNKKGTINFELKNYKVWYQKITYKNHILSWLEESKTHVKSITNLDEVLRQYIDVVKMIDNSYKPEVGTFYDFINNHTNKIILLEKLWKRSYKSVPIKIAVKTKGELLYRFFKDLESVFADSDLDRLESCNYEVKINNPKKKSYIYNKKRCEKWFNAELGKKQTLNIGTFFKKDDKNLLYIAVAKHAIHYGVIQHDNFKILPTEEKKGLKYSALKITQWYSKVLKPSDNIEIFYKAEIIIELVKDLLVIENI